MSGRGRNRRQRSQRTVHRDAAADLAAVRTALDRLHALLERIGHPRATEVAALAQGFGSSPDAAWRELNSNRWWAGTGSLAAATMTDNPGLDPQQWQSEVREFRELLIDLAEVLRARGEPNPGLESWLLAFRSWNDSEV